MLLATSWLEVNAQHRFNDLSIHAEAAVPAFQNDRGFGFYAKAAYGIGKSKSLTLSAGVSKFHSKNPTKAERITTRLVPFLVGYQQHLQRFFIEPKIGMGELGGKILNDGDYSRPSVAAAFGGLGAGYTIRQFNFGVSYLIAHGIENSPAGTWHDRNFRHASIFIAYDLFSGTDVK